MGVLEMGLSDDLAEAIGQVAINVLIESALTRVSLAVDEATGVEIERPTTVTVYAANAAEQIGRTVMERFEVKFKGD